MEIHGIEVEDLPSRVTGWKSFLAEYRAKIERTARAMTPRTFRMLLPDRMLVLFVRESESKFSTGILNGVPVHDLSTIVPVADRALRESKIGEVLGFVYLAGMLTRDVPCVLFWSGSLEDPDGENACIGIDGEDVTPKIADFFAADAGLSPEGAIAGYRSKCSESTRHVIECLRAGHANGVPIQVVRDAETPEIQTVRINAPGGKS